MPTGGGSWARLPWKTGCQTSSEDQEAPNNCCFTGGIRIAGTEKPPLDGLQKGVLLNLATKACRSIDDAWLFRGDFFDGNLLRLRDGCNLPHFFRRRGKHSLPTTLPPDPTFVFSAALGPLLHVKPPSRKSDLVRFLVRAGLHLGSVLLRVTRDADESVRRLQATSLLAQGAFEITGFSSGNLRPTSVAWLC